MIRRLLIDRLLAALTTKRVLIGVVVVAVYVALSAVSLSIILPAWPEIPEFDPRKAQELSQARKQELDVLFFNELLVKGQGFPDKLQWRQGLVMDMANEGFEVAHIALHLFDFSRGGAKTFDEKAFERLKELADSGDYSAACFFSKALFEFREIVESEHSDPLVEVAYPYVRHAAISGSARCAWKLSLYYSEEIPPVGKDPNAARKWAHISAHRGDLRAQLVLASWYMNGDQVSQDWHKARCWLMKALESNTDEAKARVASFNQTLLVARIRGNVGVPESYQPSPSCWKVWESSYRVDVGQFVGRVSPQA